MHTKTIYSFCKERENSLAVRLTVCQSCTEITVHGKTLNIRRQIVVVWNGDGHTAQSHGQYNSQLVIVYIFVI